jgi:hypothetical protein
VIRALFNDSPFVVAYGCFIVAAALVLIYAVTLYRQAHKPIRWRNIALLVASAAWVAIGILEFKIASWMQQGHTGGDVIRADICLFPIALVLTCGALLSHVLSLKWRSSVPADSGSAKADSRDGRAGPGAAPDRPRE